MINCEPHGWLSGISSIQSLSHVQLFVTSWTAACQASLSITNPWNLLKLMSFESVMSSNHLIYSSPSPLTFNLSRWHNRLLMFTCSHLTGITRLTCDDSMRLSMGNIQWLLHHGPTQWMVFLFISVHCQLVKRALMINMHSNSLLDQVRSRAFLIRFDEAPIVSTQGVWLCPSVLRRRNCMS